MKMDGVRLKTTILRKGLKQWQVAQGVRMHEANLSKIITGRIDAQEIVIKRIAEFLRVPVTDLIDLTEK